MASRSIRTILNTFTRIAGFTANLALVVFALAGGLTVAGLDDGLKHIDGLFQRKRHERRQVVRRHYFGVEVKDFVRLR